MYKEASRKKLRFSTSKGELNIEQLWTLELKDLDTLAISLEEEYNNSKGKSFIDKAAKKDETLKLKFDIALDVLKTKLAEAEEAKQKMEDKQHNERILELITEKTDESLKNKPLSELKKMLRS